MHFIFFTIKKLTSRLIKLLFPHLLTDVIQNVRTKRSTGYWDIQEHHQATDSSVKISFNDKNMPLQVKSNNLSNSAVCHIQLKDRCPPSPSNFFKQREEFSASIYAYFDIRLGQGPTGQEPPAEAKNSTIKLMFIIIFFIETKEQRFSGSKVHLVLTGGIY